MHIVVGAVVKKDNKYLLVQEAKEKCRGQWNLPAGHLDEGEVIFDAVIREAKEETGIDVVLTDFISIQNFPEKNGVFMAFNAVIKSGDIRVSDPSEILDVKWCSLAEIRSLDLRGDYVLDNILAAEEGRKYPLSIVQEMVK